MRAADLTRDRLTIGDQGSWSSLRLSPRATRLLRGPGVPIAILVVLAAVTFTSRIVHGGLIMDDWALSAEAHFGGFTGVLEDLVHLDVRRPVGAIYFATLFGVAGGHAHLLLTISAALRVLLAVCLYGLLREVRFERFDALIIAALVMLFPYSDSTWLWPSASSISL